MIGMSLAEFTVREKQQEIEECTDPAEKRRKIQALKAFLTSARRRQEQSEPIVDYTTWEEGKTGMMGDLKELHTTR